MQYLDWDSGFFGFKVARIVPPVLALEELRAILAGLKDEHVKLVYWAADSGRCTVRSEDVADMGGRIVDDKRTYLADLHRVDIARTASDARVEPYAAGIAQSDMERLAIQSGLCSRFAVDPKIPRGMFEALYVNWIRECLAGRMADEVLVIRDCGKLAGMVTVGEKNGRGDIGLIAVDEDRRRKHFGEALVRAALAWSTAKGFRRAQVVAQGANLPACRLYEKCGYTLEKSERFFHFWL